MELLTAEKKIDELAQPRLTLEEQRDHLLGISERLEMLYNNAINDPYDDPFFGDGLTAAGYEKRLRAVVRNMQIDFAENIRKDGAQWKIVDDTPSKKKDISPDTRRSRKFSCSSAAAAAKSCQDCLIQCLSQNFFGNTTSHGKGLLTSILTGSGKSSGFY